MSNDTGIDLQKIESLPLKLVPEQIVYSLYNDTLGQTVQQKTDPRKWFVFKSTSIIIRNLTNKTSDNIREFVVLEELQLKDLQLARCSFEAGSLGGSGLFSTLFRNICWRSFNIDCYNTAHSCTKYTRNRVPHVVDAILPANFKHLSEQARTGLLPFGRGFPHLFALQCWIFGLID